MWNRAWSSENVLIGPTLISLVFYLIDAPVHGFELVHMLEGFVVILITMLAESWKDDDETAMGFNPSTGINTSIESWRDDGD